MTTTHITLFTIGILIMAITARFFYVRHLEAEWRKQIRFNTQVLFFYGGRWHIGTVRDVYLNPLRAAVRSKTAKFQLIPFNDLYRPKGFLASVARKENKK